MNRILKHRKVSAKWFTPNEMQSIILNCTILPRFPITLPTYLFRTDTCAARTLSEYKQTNAVLQESKTNTLKFNSFKQLLCVCVFYYNSLRVFIHSLSRSLSPFSFFLFPYTLLLRVAAAAAQRSLGDCGCEDDLTVTTIHYTRRAFRECVTYGLCVCMCCLFICHCSRFFTFFFVWRFATDGAFECACFFGEGGALASFCTKMHTARRWRLGDRVAFVCFFLSVPMPDLPLHQEHVLAAKTSSTWLVTCTIHSHRHIHTHTHAHTYGGLEFSKSGCLVTRSLTLALHCTVVLLLLCFVLPHIQCDTAIFNCSICCLTFSNTNVSIFCSSLLFHCIGTVLFSFFYPFCALLLLLAGFCSWVEIISLFIVVFCLFEKNLYVFVFCF